MVPIGDLLRRVSRPVDVRSDTTYREIGIRSHCKGIFHKPPTTAAEIGSKRVFWVEPGCLILNIVFAWEQAVALTRDSESGMIASHRFPMYTSRNGELLPEYAWRYFSTSRGKYNLQMASPGGAGRNKTLGQEEFVRLKVPLPPINHQRKIVGVLATIDRAIERLGTLIAAKRKLKMGLAQQLLTGKRRLPGFKDQWITNRLDSLVTMIVSSVDKKSYPEETPIRLCNYTDVYYNDRITRDLKFMRATASDAEIEKYSIKQHDVIITKDSEAAGDIAKPAVVAQDMPGVLCGYHLAILRPRNVDSDFLSQLLRLPQTRKQICRIANGVTRFGLSQRSLSALELLCPEDVEQERIAAVLNAGDRVVRILEEKLFVLRRLKNGLMQNLLTMSGPLRERVDCATALDCSSLAGKAAADEAAGLVKKGDSDD